MTRTEINIPVQSREEGAVATSSCNHEDSGNTPQRRARTQMWYLARQLRSQAGGHKIWAAVGKVLTRENVAGDTELHQAPHLVSSLPAGRGTHTDSASTPPLPPRAL